MHNALTIKQPTRGLNNEHLFFVTKKMNTFFVTAELISSKVTKVDCIMIYTQSKLSNIIFTQ